VYDAGSAGEDAFVVLELIDGPPLRARMDEGPLPAEDVREIAMGLAEALAYIHGRGVVHRDVTPSNVMITDTGVKLVDFGICAAIGSPEEQADGQLWGTPAYLAPERLHGGPVGPAADVFALGVTLYRVLAGHLPWDAGTLTGVLRAHIEVDPAPLPPIDGLPAAVAALLRRCLARDPDDRPAAATVAEVLSGCLDGESTATLPTMWIFRSPRRRAARGVAALAGILVAGAAVTAALGGFSGGRGELTAASRPGTAAFGAAVGCEVRYHVEGVAAGRFRTTIAVRNAGEVDVRPWRLEFSFPGQQRVVRSWRGDWRQDGRTVRVTGGALAPGATVTAGFEGAYRGANPFPVEFRLNDVACQPVLVAADQGERVAAPPPPPGKGSGKPGKKGEGKKGPKGPH
jgi:serine/threonine-protein kinase